MTRQIPIVPTAEQEQVLWDLSEKCRLLYNFALAQRCQNWVINCSKPKTAHTQITYAQQQNALPALKKQNPEYAWVYSKVLQMVLRRLDADYKSFFSRWRRGDPTARPPRFKSCKYFTTLCYNQSGFKLDINKKTIRFSHHHPSGIELKFSLLWLPSFEGKIKQVELFQNRLQRWFVAITISEKVLDYVDNGLYQPIDLGITNLVTAVNMYGKFVQIPNHRADLFWKDKIREVQSKRDQCKKFINKWHFYQEKLKKMVKKHANQMRDFQHKISKVVVENVRTILTLFI